MPPISRQWPLVEVISQVLSIHCCWVQYLYYTVHYGIRHQLTVPRVRCSTFGSCSFASAGPTGYNLEFTAWQSAQSSCWTRSVSTDNPPVCLLLAFRWQCVRGVFYVPVFMLYKCTFTYLLTLNVWMFALDWTSSACTAILRQSWRRSCQAGL